MIPIPSDSKRGKQLLLVLALLALTIIPSRQSDAQPSIRSTPPRRLPGDLTRIRAVSLPRGTVFLVYFDSIGRAAAERSIPQLGRIYEMLADEVAADPARVEWAAVAFVADTSFVPRRVENEVRWPVHVEADGSLGPRGREDMLLVLPHEQVHSIQSSFVDKLPRWFAEGQAESVGLRVTERWLPSAALAKRAEITNAFGGTSRHLGSWGMVRVKPEAIVRQMTPEQRARRDKDPTYMPPGPWTFGPGDMVSDESDVMARYGAALCLFDELRAVAGKRALLAWYQEIWARGGSPTSEQLLASIKSRFGLSLEKRLQ